MDQPKIPTLKDTQRPQLKIRGLGVGLTLVDRLKQFKKKDLAFILAGLGTLFMAPLAEHFMMTPEGGDGQLQQGWGKGTGSNLFGGGGTPYESGNNGIAQGGAIGGGGDIITPLNVRDPSSLVLGPGAAQQPPVGSVAPPTAPTRSDADMKDALAGAASRAASSASGRAPLPIPKASLGNSGLRGLGVAGGGSSSSSGALGPIAGGPGGHGGTGGGGLNLIKAGPNYRGAAGARGSGNPTGLDATRKAGQNAGDAFSRNGSALSNLNEAAKEAIPTGGGSYGGQGQGGFGSNDKGPGGSGPGGSKSVGESLAFIAAKDRMLENLKLEFEKRRLKDVDLLLYGMRNDAVKMMGSKLAEAMAKDLVGMYGLLKGSDSTILKCPPLPDKKLSEARLCVEPTAKDRNCYAVTPGGDYSWYQHVDDKLPLDCTKVKDGIETPGPKVEEGFGGDMANPLRRDSGLSNVILASVNTICTKLNGQITAMTTSSDGSRALGTPEDAKVYGLMLAKAKQLLTARNALVKAPQGDCGVTSTFNKPAEEQLAKINELLTNPSVGAAEGATTSLLNVVAKTEEAGNSGATSAVEKLNEVIPLLNNTKAALNESEQALGSIKDRFEVPAIHKTQTELVKLMDDANRLKSTLDITQKNAQARFDALSSAKMAIDQAAKLAPALLKVNSQLEILVANKNITKLPDVKSPGTADAGSVARAVQDAEQALLKACGGQACVPAPKPASGDANATSPSEPKVDTPDDNPAVQAVLNARNSQSTYVSNIVTELNSKMPAPSPTTSPVSAQVPLK